MVQIPIPEQQPSIYDFGFDKSLNRILPNSSSGVVYNPIENSLNAAQILSGGNLTLKTLNIGGLVRQVAPGDDIQAAVDAVSREGGGTIQLIAEEYPLLAPINIKPRVNLVGVRPDVTVLNFLGSAGNVTVFGEQAYTTGTITGIASNVIVTGSGTAWLANVKAGMHLFLGTRWYEIASVLSDTSLILAEGYGDNVSFASTYRIAFPNLNTTMRDFSIKNSSVTGLEVKDTRKITIDNIFCQDNNIGASFTNVSEANVEKFLAVSNTSHGFSLNNFGFFDWESVNSISSGGAGYLVNNAKSGSFFACTSNANTADGFNLTTVDDIAFSVGAESNGGEGIEFVSASANCAIADSTFRNNTSDGIKLTASTDHVRIYSTNLRANGGYGINIAASSCDDNILFENRYSGNTSGAISDSGSGTQIL